MIARLTQKSAEPYTLLQNFARSSREKRGRERTRRRAIRRGGRFSTGRIRRQSPRAGPRGAGCRAALRSRGEGRDDVGLREGAPARDDQGSCGDGEGGASGYAGRPRRDARERNVGGDP